MLSKTMRVFEHLLNIVVCPTFPEKFTWNIVIAPFLLHSVVIFTARF